MPTSGQGGAQGTRNPSPDVSRASCANFIACSRTCVHTFLRLCINYSLERISIIMAGAGRYFHLGILNKCKIKFAAAQLRPLRNYAGRGQRFQPRILSLAFEYRDQTKEIKGKHEAIFFCVIERSKRGN